MRSFGYFAIGGCTWFGVEHFIYFVIFNIKILFIPNGLIWLTKQLIHQNWFLKLVHHQYAINEIKTQFLNRVLKDFFTRGRGSYVCGPIIDYLFYFDIIVTIFYFADLYFLNSDMLSGAPLKTLLFFDGWRPFYPLIRIYLLASD